MTVDARIEPTNRELFREEGAMDCVGRLGHMVVFIVRVLSMFTRLTSDNSIVEILNYSPPSPPPPVQYKYLLLRL